MSDLDRILDRISRPFEQEEEEIATETPSWLEAVSVPMEGGQVRPMTPRGTRSERLEARELTRSRIEQQVGGPLREEGGGITSIRQRFRLQGGGRRGEEDIMRSIQEYIPGSEVHSIRLEDGSDRILFRRPDRDDFEFINPAGFDRGDLGAAASYLFNFENLVATAASVITRGFSFPVRLALVGAGAGSGRGADIALDRALGDRPAPIEDTLGDVALSVIFGAAGEGAGTGLSRGVNFLRGEGLVRLPEGKLSAIRAGRELDLDPLTSGQLHPLAQRMEAQTLATTAVPSEAYASQQAAARRGLVSYRDTLTGESVSPVLTDAELERLVYQRTLALREAIDNPQVALREGRRALQRGRQAFEESSAAWIDRKYIKALEAAGDDVTFNFRQGLEGTVESLLQGTRVPTRFAMEEGTEETVRASKTLSPRLRDLIGRMLQSSPDPDGAVAWNAPDTLRGRVGYEALREWRTELDSIRRGNWQAADPFKRREMRQAQQLYEAVTDVLANADGPGRIVLETPTRVPPASIASRDDLLTSQFEESAVIQASDFSRLWRAANTSNAWRERVINMDHIQKLGTEANPVVLSAQFSHAGEYESLRVLKRVMPEEHWKAFTDSFESRLLSRPEQIGRIFDDYAIDPDTLNLLIPRGRQLEFRALGRAAEQLQASEAIWARQTNEGQRLLDMIDSGNSREVVELINMSGGPESPTGKLFRAGIIENILNKTTETSPITNELIVRPRDTANLINQYLSSGQLSQILTEADRLTLGRYAAYLQSVGVTSDVGGVISGSELAGQAFDLLNPARATKGILKQAKNAFLARAFTNPQVNQLIFGRGTQTPPRQSLRTTATIMSLIARDVATEEGQRNFNLFFEDQEEGQE